ncbi:MAG: hypothetical protein OEV43_08330 [Coriobacteriia bacterium]|nr:hypothetical protein [Coriobacteriia bacterium]
MAEPDVVAGDIDAIEQITEEGDDQRRSRRSLFLLLLLLLLLCGVTSIVDTWISYEPDVARFVSRNLECLQCHTELIPDLSKPSVHNPFLMKECTVCHTAHGKEVERTTYAGGSKTWKRYKTLVEWLPLKWIISLYDTVAGVTDSEDGGEVVSQETQQVKDIESQLVMPEEQLCWICHGDLGAQTVMPYPHNPFEQGYCTNCHDPHAADFRALLVQDERDLCVTCHPMGPQLSRAQVHPPAGQRWCTNCHDPHASNWRGILVDNQRDLCFMCHPSVAPLSLKAVQHNPFAYDNCTGCHEPHGSDYEPLLTVYQPELCYGCHRAIRYDFLKVSHHPVGSPFLNCADCHNPHAADYSALLVARDNNLCYTCHSYPTRAIYDGSAHWRERLLCIQCHTPHGSNFGPILRDSHPDLCLNCHTRYEGYNKHPVRPVYYDVNAGKGLTCSSTCHDPHGTSKNYMLKQYRFAEDGNCLICHAATRGGKVGVDY